MISASIKAYFSAIKACLAVKVRKSDLELRAECDIVKEGFTQFLSLFLSWLLDLAI